MAYLPNLIFFILVVCSLGLFTRNLKRIRRNINLGKDLMNRIIEDTKDVGKIETHPKFEGRQMVMIIQPI